MAEGEYAGWIGSWLDLSCNSPPTQNSLTYLWVLQQILLKAPIHALSMPNTPWLVPLTSEDLKLVPSILAAVRSTDHRCPLLLLGPGHSPEDAGYKKLAQEDTGQEEKNRSGWEGSLS